MQNLTILTGASRGMGLAMAQQLVQPGARLLCISRQRNPELQAQADAAGTVLEQWSADLGDAAAVAVQLAEWLQACDPQRLASATLINNAGAISPLVAVRDSDPSALAQALRVGVEAPLQLCAAFLGATRNWAVPRKVLNISSGLGRRAMASSAAYCAAKAGMDHFSRCIALEEAAVPNGAKVCSLAPGVIATDMQLQLRSADPAHFPDLPTFQGLHAGGQLSSPQDAARRVLAYLHSPSFGRDAVGDVRG
jgi:NAD(P)-dependent dehydrogenase (short-subunit alcohol dehydrogenase family)